MSWRYKLNACDTRLMRETWHHREGERKGKANQTLIGVNWAGH